MFEKWFIINELKLFFSNTIWFSEVQWESELTTSVFISWGFVWSNGSQFRYLVTLYRWIGNHLSREQIKVFDHHKKIRPFDNRTHLGHLHTRLVWYSDNYCIMLNHVRQFFSMPRKPAMQFDNRTHLGHLNTRLVRFSDGYFIMLNYVKQTFILHLGC